MAARIYERKKVGLHGGTTASGSENLAISRVLAKYLTDVVQPQNVIPLELASMLPCCDVRDLLINSSGGHVTRDMLGETIDGKSMENTSAWCKYWTQ